MAILSVCLRFPLIMSRSRNFDRSIDSVTRRLQQGLQRQACWDAWSVLEWRSRLISLLG